MLKQNTEVKGSPPQQLIQWMTSWILPLLVMHNWVSSIWRFKACWLRWVHLGDGQKFLLAAAMVKLTWWCSGALQTDHCIKHPCTWLDELMSRGADANGRMMLHWNRPDVTNADDDVEGKSLAVISNNLQRVRDSDALMMMSDVLTSHSWWAAIETRIGRHCHSLGW